jgi:hypothetical protein
MPEMGKIDYLQEVKREHERELEHEEKSERSMDKSHVQWARGSWCVICEQRDIGIQEQNK